MASLRQPFEEPRLGGREVRVGEADRLEAELAAPLANLRGKRGVIHDIRS